jgi:hypothetical protein
MVGKSLAKQLEVSITPIKMYLTKRIICSLMLAKYRKKISKKINIRIYHLDEK